MSFEIEHEDKGSDARAGVLKTNHGNLQTPFFMPVATKAGVKTLSPDEVMGVGTQSVISNAFLLYLKPGVDVIESAGGLHQFSGLTNTAIFTDSGGFQMLRESFFESVSRKGVTFRSPFDESRHVFTPEKCMEVQMGLDPSLDDATGDADNDGLTNLAEYQLGLDASDVDSDGDQMPDGWEPHSPQTQLAQFARWLLYVRSHWLRMPPALLTRHLLRKAWARTRSQIS